MTPDRRIGTGEPWKLPEAVISTTMKIEMADPELVISYLPKGKHISIAWPSQNEYLTDDFSSFNPRRKDTHHPLGQWSLATTPEASAVLYDDGAAFCSPLLAFDNNGSAIHCYDSPIGRGTFNDLDRYFFPAVQERLQGQLTLVMGGTNVAAFKGEEQQVGEQINNVVSGIEERLRQIQPNAVFYPLISKQYDNQIATHPIIPERTTMRGFFYIPPYIATDQQHHVLAIAETNTDVLRNALRRNPLYFLSR